MTYNILLADGDPPLTRETAECFMELINSMMMVARGIEPEPLPEETKEAWLRELIANYQYITPEQRQFIASGPEKWAEFQECWPQLSDMEKVRMQQIWAYQFGIPPQAMAPRGNFAPENRGYNSDSTRFDRWDREYRNACIEREKREAEDEANGIIPPHKQIGHLQKEIHEAQKRGDELRVAELQVELQQKLQERQANTQMMSNMQSMMHQTSMSIINNISTPKWPK